MTRVVKIGRYSFSTTLQETLKLFTFTPWFWLGPFAQMIGFLSPFFYPGTVHKCVYLYHFTIILTWIRTVEYWTFLYYYFNFSGEHDLSIKSKRQCLLQHSLSYIRTQKQIRFVIIYSYSRILKYYLGFSHIWLHNIYYVFI